MIDLERYFVEAKIRENAGIANKAKRNEECLNFTKAKADEFIKKFGFLTKYGFVLGLRFHESISVCNNRMNECFVHIENPERRYETNVFFPMEQIQKGKCDFCSRSLDPTHSSGEYEQYTYASGAMTLATLFG